MAKKAASAMTNLFILFPEWCDGRKTGVIISYSSLFSDEFSEAWRQRPTGAHVVCNDQFLVRLGQIIYDQAVGSGALVAWEADMISDSNRGEE